MDPSNGYGYAYGYGYNYQNGHNGTNGASSTSETRQMRPRPFTVDEALPYSPFSSVVPFNSDIIPLPTIGLGSSSSLFSNAAETQQGRESLGSLNAEATNPYQTSQRLQRTLKNLEQLLKPEDHTIYNFKIGSKIASLPDATPLKPKLSPFAQMLYDSTKVEYKTAERLEVPAMRHKLQKQRTKSQSKSRNPSSSYVNTNSQPYTANTNATIFPEAITTKPVAEHANVAPKAKSQIAVEIPLPKALAYTHKQNPIPVSNSHGMKISPKISHIQSSVPSPRIAPVAVQDNKQTQNIPPSSSQPSISVVIPQSQIKPEEYKVVEALPDSPDSPAKNRKRAGSDEYEGNVSGVIDQREKADIAARNLREYLQDVFEAENQFQPETNMSSNFLISTNEGIGLAANTQTRLEGLLNRIIEVGRIKQVPLEDLIRIQKLSEAALKEAETLDLKIDEEMGESDVESLFLQISNAELGLKSARTSLRVMTGGRDEKQLYSEDLIQSALNAFKNIMENFIIPIVELRSTGSTSTLFKLLSPHKKVILNLLTQCRRLLSLMAVLVANIDLSETVINSLEYAASRLIFVENAHAEKDSVLGIPKFDNLRVIAMDVLAQVFNNNPKERAEIFNEILTSLEKLPVTKQSARQFKLADGGSIQLVSALIMKLIQTSASKTDDAKEKRRRKAQDALTGDDEGHEDGVNDADNRRRYDTERRAIERNVTAIQELKDCGASLLESATQNTGYVVNFIVSRAIKSTKNGDTPYRNLLDLFVEDFVTCLNSPDWPAAELLLRLFLFKMVQLAEAEKTPAPAKNMALDLLGSMGAAISELHFHVRKSAASLENRDGRMGQALSRMVEESLKHEANTHEILTWGGPYFMCLDFMEDRCFADPQLASSISLLIVEWASQLADEYDNILDSDPDHERIEENYGKVAYRLRMMITDKKWFSTEYGHGSVDPSHARLAYSVTLLHSTFCTSFSRVLDILLRSMFSEQATVRSKSLKSVNQVLETDPTILEREPTAKQMILRCSNDPSVGVRDSALGLIGKCISLVPSLEVEMTPSILQRVNDSGVGVRKRAMKLLKDIYLNNTNKDVRASIADAILYRVTDLDDSVQELARSTIEEVWMLPFYKITGSEDTSVQAKLAISDHVTLIIKTAQRQNGTSGVLDKVLQNLLSQKSKYPDANFKVCKALVAAMFETIIDNAASEDSDAPNLRESLEVLTIFAKSNANLFTADQIQLLQPYVANVGSGDEAAIYRSVVIIFRYVLPSLPKVQHGFLTEIRKHLLPTMTRSPKSILDDIVACLWIISSVLDDYHNLTRVVLSSLAGIQKMKSIDLNDSKRADLVKKLTKLLLICGMCGKHCDLDPQHEIFKEKEFPKMKGTSVSKLMVDTFAPFATPSQPMEVRKHALDAMGMVCQSWPKNFSAANVYTTFIQVFSDQDLELETIVMRAFKEYLSIEEKRSEESGDGAVGTGTDSKAKLGVMGGSQGDGVALDIAQRFLKDIARIALGSQDKEALLAAEVVASINRQGLVHPKETACTLIALETSPTSKIADIAFREHRALHEKHETILEKEYMRAVLAAYAYQRDVVKDTHGATLNPFTSKLWMMIEVMKISKVKNRKKLFDSLCSRINFDPAKLDTIEDLPHHLDFAQFIIENLAFFEYQTVDELLSTIDSMEKLVAGTGTGIAHAIETEVLHISLDQPANETDANGHSHLNVPKRDSMRLQQLTAISIMLTNLWEARTYLRRQFGLMNRDGKVKGATKDLSRAPVRVASVTGDKFWSEVCGRMTSCESEDKMEAQCRAFVELLNVDHDFKVSAENDEIDERGRMSTPSDDEDGTPGPPGGSGRGRKRKAGANGATGGRKKRARSSSIPRGRGKPKVTSFTPGKGASVERNDEGEWE
ncbi:similar to sister chromatid cohesion protein Mis4 [Botrytis cinerea T4]|uniref:Sister chromatid cohesion protein n=1 Tax=Botryotinia fuckeliana (strain T4) TaxID=999810 RepID=G2YQD6_BOTF4|nr:similar to sister chromatid cohesion protein Mis4 [Botrytis cinerea T4]